MFRFWRHRLHLSIRVVPVLFALVLWFSGVSVWDRAQDQEPIRVAVNLVMVDATVKTKAGQIMSDLKKTDFEVREDGAAQKIALFSRDELPLNVALVLDLSDSIGPFLGPLQQAAKTTLAALKADDQVALFTFSTDAELRVPLTKDKAQIAGQFDTFKAGGAATIKAVLFAAAQYLLATAPKGRRGEGYLVTEGDGLAYSYSVYDSFGYLTQWADRILLIPGETGKVESWFHPLLTAGTVIVCAMKEETQR